MLDADNKSRLDEARTRLTGIQTHLPGSIPVAGISTTSKIPFTALSCREGLIWRAEELARTACDCFERQDVVAGITLVRAFFETAAALWHLKVTMERQFVKGIESDLHDQILQVMLGHRSSDHLPKAINVQTFIDRLTKTFPHARQNYDDMSEYAHPNWMGTALPFSVIDKEAFVVTFGRGVRGSERHATLGLSCLNDALAVAELAYNGIADFMQAFTKLCEDDLVKRKPALK